MKLDVSAGTTVTVRTSITQTDTITVKPPDKNIEAGLICASIKDCTFLT